MWIKNLMRPFRSHAGYTWATLIILGICFGACLAVFSVFQSVFFADSSYENPDELYWLRSDKLSQRINPDLGRRLKEDSSIFDSFGCYSRSFRTKMERGEDRYSEVRVSLTIGDIFQVLGVKPVIGRGFHQADMRLGTETAGIASHGFYTRELAGDPAMIGELVIMEGHPVRIIGVLPKDFSGPSSTESFDLYIPATHYAPFVRSFFEENINFHSMTGIGRKESGRKNELVDRLNAFFKSYVESVPDKALIEPRLYRYREDTFQQRHDLQRLYSLIGGVFSALFLIAITNSLTFVSLRTSWRSNEVLIRIALGASSRRMLLHHAAEAGTFSVISCLAGLLVGWSMFHGLRIYYPDFTPVEGTGFITPEVIIFSLLTCLLLLIVFAVIPFLWMKRLSLSNVVKGNRTVSRKSRVMPVFAAVQVAVSTILVVFCFLFVKSSLRAVSVDPGYNYKNIVSFYCDISHLSRDTSELNAIHDEVVASITAIPEIELATRGWINFLQDMGTDPLLYDFESTSDIKDELKLVRRYYAGEDYFKLLEIPFVKGRSFEMGDRSRQDQLVVVNQALVEKYFPGEDPLTVRFRMFDQNGPLYHVIGVIPNFMITRDIVEYPVAVFNSATFEYSGFGVVARTHAGSANGKRAVEKHLNQNLSRLGAVRVHTGSELYRESVAELRVAAVFLSFFGLQAILLTSIGLVIIFSFSAELWKRDLAIRMALGATSMQVIRHVCLRFGIICLAGITTGLIIVLIIAPHAASFLYNVSPADPGALFFSALLVAALGAFVSTGISLRTLKIQPAREIL